MKHKIQNKSKKIHKTQKSAGYEEHHEGKSETILVSEYRKYKRIVDREASLEVSLSNIHGLGLFTVKE
jgi:CTP-dependent riboflavin kinase